MSRKAKYATLSKYQPYINIIRKDLGIPDDVNVVVEFKNWRARKWGTGVYWPLVNEGKVCIKNRLSHKDVLSTLMHEFRHVWQHYTGNLADRESRHTVTKRGNVKWEYYVTWNGAEYRDYSTHTAKEHDLYEQTPWEVDARAYEMEIDRLFPNNKLPAATERKLIGKINGVTLYRIREL